MASSGYGVLVGTIHEGQEDPAGDATPHYEIRITADDADYRAAVNVRSSDGSDLLVLVDAAFASASPKLDLATLAAGPKGFTRLSTGPGGDGLDYVRDDLFDLSAMTAEPATGGGASLTATFTALVSRATADANAVAMVFGEFFSDPGRDAVFGFSPAQGVHDIHMMQGNSGGYARENKANGDGALFVRFGDGTAFAFFARFDTQAVATNPTTGAPAD